MWSWELGLESPSYVFCGLQGTMGAGVVCSGWKARATGLGVLVVDDEFAGVQQCPEDSANPFDRVFGF